MANTTTTIKVSASPEQVWKLIGGFNSLPDWLPSISSSELSEGGRVRHLADIDGEIIVERLEVFNDKERYYTYSIMKAPFPVSDYQATITVRDIAGSKTSLVEWSGTFTPVGISEEEAINLFHGLYEDGLKALGQALKN
ncbi:SRPBCC family protein [Peribacillus simplex]|uniref:SRPBCC family protein n=1 Tax=Peribacillus TaxID=2675229 RepID=UPI0010BEF7CF|nr:MULTISPECIES: SRPBCC family protein [Peribacillus]MCY9002455.1 SRPBCC family protein [Peribacillus frigoritolerans]TKH03434.1 SRPBCC family protein [Peribacillus simplex]